jgi:hypothetical protein
MMKKLISKIIHEAQSKMPTGQSWNLHSKAACDMLAEKIAKELELERVFVRVEVDGSTLEDIRVFRNKPFDLGDTSDLDGGWDKGHKVFEIKMED